jgi:omega-amidase
LKRVNTTLYTIYRSSLIVGNISRQLSTTSSLMSENIRDMRLKVALCQLKVGPDKENNVKNAVEKIRYAAEQGAKLVVLPECFNCPYGNQYFPEYAEDYNESETLKTISQVAREKNVYIVAGSIPTREDEGKLFNTSVAFDPLGQRVATFRKMHLFDINVPGKIVFQESKTLTPGNKFSTFDVQQGENKISVGMGICFDIRFSEMAQLYERKGCSLLVYPGAFNMTTGPLHWELLARARALDNQLYVCVCSPARDTSASYVAFGHSMIVDPWASKVIEAQEGEEVIISELDFKKVTEIRAQIPTIANKRHDLYTLTENTK